VAFDGGIVASDSDVTECFRLQQVVQHGEQVVAVVVPAQVEHLRQGVHLADRQLWQQTEKKSFLKNYNHSHHFFFFTFSKKLN
jgi:hypothetical protein